MAEFNGTPDAHDPVFAAALEQFKALLQGGQGDVTTGDVDTSVRERAPVRTVTGAQPMPRDRLAGVAVDWSEPQADRPRAPQPRSYASSAGNPLGDLIASYTNSNALGRTVSGIEDIGGGLATGAYHLSGIPGVTVAAENLAAAEANGDPVRGAAALGQGFLSTLPYNRLAGALFSSAPRALAAGATFAGVPIAAGTAFLSDPAEAAGPRRKPAVPPQPAGPPPDDGLQPEQRSRRDALNTQMTRDQWLPPAQRRELEALTKIMTDYQSGRNAARTETDRTIALEKAKLAAEQERQRSQAEERERWANTPLGKAYPWAPPALAATGFALGTLGANAISRAGVRNYNTNIRDMSDRWSSAVERTQRARTPASRESGAALARELGDEFTSMEARGPRGYWPSIVSGIGGTELGLAAPTLIDYTTSTPGSPLRQYVTQSMSDPYELAGRLGAGVIFGGAAGKYISSIAGRNKLEPSTYRAETNVLAGSNQPRLIPQESGPLPLPSPAPLPAQALEQMAPRAALPPPTAQPASSSSNAPASPPPSAPRTSSTSTTDWPEARLSHCRNWLE